MIKTLGILTTCFVITACTSAKEQFDCPLSRGVSCKSMTEVNQLIDREERLVRPEDLDLEDIVSVKPTGLNKKACLRIWVAPHEDSKGQDHEASLIYMDPKE